MPTKDFTLDEVVQLCCEISTADNILCQVNKQKKSIFKRSNSFEKPSQPIRKTSVIARRLSLVNGIPCMGSNFPGSIGTFEKLSQEVAELKTTNEPKKNVEGLDGRSVVALAILCDENGTPFRTYTEHQDIPEEEINSADKVFISRVPIKNYCAVQQITGEDGDTLRSAASVLLDLDLEKREKLFKKLSRAITKLHTTDFKTASSFIKTDRYAEVKEDIKSEMLDFLTKEIKVLIVSSKNAQTNVA